MPDPWNVALNAFVAGLTGLGLLLSILGLRAWFRYGEPRLGLLFLSFLGFLAQGLLLTWGLFLRDRPAGRIDDLVLPVTALSGASLLLVYFATLVPPRRRPDA
jgi:hypothetical protein